MKANLDNEAVFLEENQRFHDASASSSDNPIFGHLMNALLDIIDGAPIGVEYPKHRRQIVYEAHQSIYETLARKDANAAAAAMYEHILQYAEYVEDNFPEVPDKPISWAQQHRGWRACSKSGPCASKERRWLAPLRYRQPALSSLYGDERHWVR